MTDEEIIAEIARIIKGIDDDLRQASCMRHRHDLPFEDGAVESSYVTATIKIERLLKENNRLS
jgi:hypothetical protein